MRLRCVAVVLAATLLSTSTLSLAAQQPVRILRHSPPDTARPGDVITISFDRPVVGSLDRTPDPARIIRIEPRLEARLQWRDPATLRIVPRAPLAPGSDGEAMVLPATIESTGGPAFYVLTVDEVPLRPPTTPDVKGMIVERWFERFDDGQPVTEVKEGDLVRGRLRVTVPTDREFVAVEDLLPAGLEFVDLSLRTSSLGPFESEASRDAVRAGNRANTTASKLPWLYGTWAGGWWSPWEHREIRDDRVVYFARVLWKGSYTASYVARAATAGTFIRPPAHAEEMYNPSVGGRSDGGTFRVLPLR